MFSVGRVASTVSSCARKHVPWRANARFSFSSARAPLKRNSTALFVVVTGAAVFLGWAAAPRAQTDAEPVFAEPDAPKKKPRLVILGSGWAGLELIRNVDTTAYDISIVSPRNYFLFTPLLASASVGTVEFLSVVEPLRKFCKRANTDIQYFEATCTDVLYDQNIIRCAAASGVESAVKTFDLEYDYLVVAVGSHTSNMGVKGVQQNCLFLKDITDSKSIRARIIECLETANYPTQSIVERARLLHFVIVGGGPTGVEFSAELHDFVKDDLPKYYPNLARQVNITLVQGAEHILNTYDHKISQYAEDQFQRENIRLLTNSRVIEVSPTHITVFDKIKNKNVSIPCGMCVWATGVGPTPLTMKLAEKIPEQNHNKALVADEYLRIKGIPNQNVYAVGDCLTVTQKKMMDKLVDLFTEADMDRDGSLSLGELEGLFKTMLPEYPHLQPYSHGVKRLMRQYDTNRDGKLQMEEFQNILLEVDQNLKSVPTTAQAASQAGKYLANSLNTLAKDGNSKNISPFYYRHLGSFAYVGGDHAVLDSSAYQGGGFGVWWLWRATYFSKQLSWRNRFSLAFDWIKTRLNGRDISKI